MEPQNNSCDQRGDPASGVLNVQNNLIFSTSPQLINANAELDISLR